VGDVQGCLDQLQSLLAAVGFRAGTDRLHPVGDLVAKGPDSEGVLRRCVELGAEPVLGNHDLNWLKKGRIGDAALREWLRAQPTARVLDGVILVHGGLHPKWDEAKLRSLTPVEQDYAVNVRYCDADGNRPADDWPPPGPPFRPWDDWYHGKKRVVFGHWARRGLVVRPQCVGLDTGCVYGGELSAWIAEEDRIVQVPGWRR
ncbi:MAG TPA: metallophosphoesterase, partial [Acetobacteraceae bacterium]|nr:metallophosphoesterase [Acetobacteraceae bacterium]